jgi:hypothetical protein
MWKSIGPDLPRAAARLVLDALHGDASVWLLGARWPATPPADDLAHFGGSE